MSGKEIQEEAVLAAVKSLKTVEASTDSTDYANRGGPGAHADQAAASASLENLFAAHHDRIFRTAYRVTGNASDAEDVLQTVFLRVARGQESAESAENAEAYFSRAAINASLDLLRSRKRSKAVAMDDVVNTASISAFVQKQNPETDHEDQELRTLIRDAVAKLGATAGQMFALRYFEGFGNAEIATLMNTSPLVVGVTLHRARARMRREIGRYLRKG
jgi:RNA polymerase sigma-70 factor (ECF subfamily)